MISIFFLHFIQELECIPDSYLEVDLCNLGFCLFSNKKMKLDSETRSCSRKSNLIVCHKFRALSRRECFEINTHVEPEGENTEMCCSCPQRSELIDEFVYNLPFSVVAHTWSSFEAFDVYGLSVLYSSNNFSLFADHHLAQVVKYGASYPQSSLFLKD